MSLRQSADRSTQWKEMFNKERLHGFNLIRKTHSLTQKVDLYKQVLICLAEKKVTGARRLLSSALREGRSTKAILLQLEKAFTGKYKATGFSDEEFDIAILALRLGGQALLYTLSQAEGFLGVSTVYEKMRDTTIRFALCATTEESCLARAVAMNLERLLPLWHGEKRIFMLQMDEIAVEQRARYCKETDEILGLCVQHTDPSLTKFSIDNLERISQSLGRDADKGGMHIGHEASVIAISALGAKAHHAYPVVVFAGCK
ncbi:unnamed protein product, partial [Scytosiphon promiscuus]